MGNTNDYLVQIITQLRRHTQLALHARQQRANAKAVEADVRDAIRIEAAVVLSRKGKGSNTPYTSSEFLDGSRESRYLEYSISAF